jgi:hypothetical protein
MTASDAGAWRRDVEPVLERILADADADHSIDLSIPTPTIAFAREIASAIDSTPDAQGLFALPRVHARTHEREHERERPDTLAGACFYNAVVATEAPLFEPHIGRLTGIPIERIRPHVAPVAALYLRKTDAEAQAADGFGHEHEYKYEYEYEYGHDHAHDDRHQLSARKKRWELTLLLEADATSSVAIDVPPNPPAGGGAGTGDGDGVSSMFPTAPTPSASRRVQLRFFTRRIQRLNRLVCESVCKQVQRVLLGLGSESRWDCPDCGQSVPRVDGAICPACGTNATHAFDAGRAAGGDGNGVDVDENAHDEKHGSGQHSGGDRQ